MSKYFICAPGKEQGAKIAKEKLDEIFQKFPLLKNEYVKYNASKDYVTVVFKNNSIFDVVGALDSTRGGKLLPLLLVTVIEKYGKNGKAETLIRAEGLF